MNTQITNNDAPASRDRENKIALVRMAAAKLRETITRARLAIVPDRRLGDVDYLEAVEALTCGPLGTDDADPDELLLSVTYGAGLPADDYFRGSGNGTKEYGAVFTL